MKNKIYFSDNQKFLKITTEHKNAIKKAINAALLHEKISFPCEISVTFTDNDGIHELNKQYRNKDSATDVLSFPLFEREELFNIESDEAVAIGDIVISTETALSQSESYGHSLEREIAFLAVHSILHLVGYDHEVSDEDEKYMNDAAEEILFSVGITRETSMENKIENKGIKRTGFISILGRPNVGKSTLLNAIVGEKVAIVSKKPQTTRNRITGVFTKGDDQFVFVDTPGIHKPKNKLGEYMMKAVGDATVGIDAVIFVVEPTEKPSKTEIEIANKINAMKVPCILVINKADFYKKTKILTTIDGFSKLCEFSSVIPISALNNDGVDIVIDEIAPFLKEEAWYYPDDIVTDQPMRQIASEIIREKLLRLLDDEVPHGIAVVIEQFEEKPKLVSIRAEIYCEKEAHKRIIIGKGGETLKKAATYAREDMEKIFENKVFLDIWVKVKENWRDSQVNLNRLGFRDEK